MVLKVIGAEVVWWNVQVSFVLEEKLDVVVGLVVFETTDSIWVTALVALEKQLRNGDDIVWTSLVWEIAACWCCSFSSCFPITFG
jgi:hypothetical protein